MALGSATDTARLLQEAGEVVTFNGVSSYGVLEQLADLHHPALIRGLQSIGVTTVLVQTDVFTHLRLDGIITVAALPYRIDRISPEDDGTLTRIYLARRS